MFPKFLIMGECARRVILITIVVTVSLPTLLLGQSAIRLKYAYDLYQKTGDENHLRVQLINEINFPDFLVGANFIKKQNHSRSIDIMIGVLKSYNRYDLLEKVFFTAPIDQPYRLKYKDLYYLTLLNNLKNDVLLKTLISQIEKISQRFNNDINLKKNQINSDEIYKLIHLEMHYLQEIARKGERQLVRWEEIIQTFPFSDPVKQKQEIIFNHFYSALEGKKYLKKIYQSILSSQVIKLAEEQKKETIIAEKTNEKENTDHLNSAKNFFNLDELVTESPTSNRKAISLMVDSSGVIYSTIRNKTETAFFNTLYRRGYYRNYLHLIKKFSERFTPNSPEYTAFIKTHHKKLSQAYLYSKAPLNNIDNISSQTLQMRKLFFENNYRKIITEFTSHKRHELYLLSLAAHGKWNALFQIVGNSPRLIEIYQIINLLVNHPDLLLKRLQSQPSEKLHAWQLDFLNLVEDGLSPQKIAPVIADFLFKKKDILSKLNPEMPLLYEYGITLQAQIFYEIGNSKRVGDTFRRFYNQMENPAFKEHLMFLHGIAYLSEDPDEGEKVLFQILTMNPQSPYRFDIEEALNSLL